MPRKPIDAYDANIGFHIRRLRLLAGMTQEELGEAINTNKVSVSMIENGQQKLSFWQADQVARKFGISTEAFRNL